MVLIKDQDLANIFTKITHFDDSSILTFSGKLLSIVKIDPLYNGNFLANINQLSIEVKKALSLIYDKDIGFYLKNSKYLLDQDSPLVYHKSYKFTDFAQFISNQYYQKFGPIMYGNIFYIVIIVKTDTLIEPDSILSIFNSNSVYQAKNQALNRSHNKLKDAVKNITMHLSAYKPRVLGIYKENDKKFSEIIDFYYKLLNIPSIDLETFYKDGYLARASYSISDNIVEIKYKDELRYLKFIGIKELANFDNQIISCLMANDIKFDLTEINIPANPEVSKNKINYIKRIIAGNKNALGDYLHSDYQDFYNTSVSLSILSHDRSLLIKNTNTLLIALSNFGIPAVSEEVLNEYNLHWHFPGNLTNVHFRQFLKSRYDVGDIVAIDSSIGNIVGSNTKYICVFKTKNSTNCYFNYFQDDKGSSALIDNPLILRLLVNFSTRKIDYNTYHFYISSNSSAIAFCKLMEFRATNLINLFNYLDKNNIGIFREFIINLIKFGDIIINFDSTVHKVEIEKLDYFTSTIDSEQTSQQKKINNNNELISDAIVDKFLECIILINERAIVKSLKMPTIKIIFDIYSKTKNPNIKILNILEFMCTKYEFLSESYYFDNLNSNLYLDISILEKKSFHDKFYPYEDERKLVQFNNHVQFHELFAKNYLEMYIDIICKKFHNKSSNSKHTFIFDNLKVLSEYEIITMVEYLNTHHINVFVHSDQYRFEDKFDHVFKNDIVSTEVDNSFKYIYKEKNRDPIILDLDIISGINDVINLNENEAQDVILELDKGKSTDECIRYLMRLSENRNLV